MIIIPICKKKPRTFEEKRTLFKVDRPAANAKMVLKPSKEILKLAEIKSGIKTQIDLIDKKIKDLKFRKNNESVKMLQELKKKKELLESKLIKISQLSLKESSLRKLTLDERKKDRVLKINKINNELYRKIFSIAHGSFLNVKLMRKDTYLNMNVSFLNKVCKEYLEKNNKTLDTLNKEEALEILSVADSNYRKLKESLK